MQNYYQHFPEIDNVYWTDYFLNEFIPKYKFYESIKESLYNYVFYANKNQYPGILELSTELTTKLKFPPIEYFLIFKHVDIDQPIHADGENIVRYSSFNLPLFGYAGTNMCFYKMKDDTIKPEIRNAYYYNKENLTVIDKFSGENEWVLVNSGVPHNIVDVNSTDPRITVCIRFYGNPTFQDLINNAKS
jgi:hypothetical protein